ERKSLRTLPYDKLRGRLSNDQQSIYSATERFHPDPLGIEARMGQAQESWVQQPHDPRLPSGRQTPGEPLADQLCRHLEEARHTLALPLRRDDYGPRPTRRGPAQEAVEPAR